ncbi:MAG: DsbA family oxidoreductase [Pseudomonadales bacterium]
MLQIDIFSDLICPWCFVGKRRLDRVLAEETMPVALRWRAYQLRPGLPEAGIDRQNFLRQRFGDAADPARLPERLASEAEAEQIEFAYQRVAKIPNTKLGHRLMAAAEPLGLQHELAEALFRAYFIEGVDVGERQALRQLAIVSGFSAEQAEQALTDQRWLDVVEADLAAAQEHDVSGVPCLIFAGKFPLPGVQADDVLRHFITRAAARM